MVMGCVRLRLLLRGSHSLKDKRSVSRSLKDRLRSRFQAAVSEVADHDKWQSLVLGVGMVGHEPYVVDQALDKVVQFVRNHGRAELIDVKKSVTTMDEWSTL